MEFAGGAEHSVEGVARIRGDSGRSPGVGLDIGTAFIVAAVRQGQRVVYNFQRDAFYPIKPVSDINARLMERSLRKRGAHYIIKDGIYYVVGQQAVEIANERNDNVRRPLHRGVISSKERDAFPMVQLIIEAVVGRAVIEGELCYYSVPADPIDAEFDSVYHEKVMGSFLKRLGYNPYPVAEAEALMYSELLDEELTGMVLSFGAGMVNVCISHLGEPFVKFSTSKAGDWIDRQAAIQLGLTESLVQAEKEGDFYLDSPANKIQEVVSIYYGSVIDYTVDNVVYELNRLRDKIPSWKKPIVVVASGGTAVVPGFLERLKHSLSRVRFPFEVRDVRLASGPLHAVAHGCLLCAGL